MMSNNMNIVSSRIHNGFRITIYEGDQYFWVKYSDVQTNKLLQWYPLEFAKDLQSAKAMSRKPLRYFIHASENVTMTHYRKGELVACVRGNHKYVVVYERNGSIAFVVKDLMDMKEKLFVSGKIYAPSENEHSIDYLRRHPDVFG